MLVGFIILVAAVELVALVSFLWGADGHQSTDDIPSHHV